MKFIDILQAINSTIYNSILEETNKLQDKLTLATFGEDGIDLSNLSDFERFIKSPISQARTEMLRLLFSYRGE